MMFELYVSCSLGLLYFLSYCQYVIVLLRYCPFSFFPTSVFGVGISIGLRLSLIIAYLYLFTDRSVLIHLYVASPLCLLVCCTQHRWFCWWWYLCWERARHHVLFISVTGLGVLKICCKIPVCQL